MKSVLRLMALLLASVMVFGLLSGFAFALSVSDSGFTKIGPLPNEYEATQGMCTDGKYIYTFKMPSGNNDLARIYRTDISTGTTILMHVTYDTSLTNFLALGHGNDMCAVVHEGVTYLYLTTMYHRSHSSFATHSIWKFRVTGDTVEKVANYDVLEYGTDDMDFTGLTVYEQTDKDVTLLSADGKYIYTIKIGLDQPSGIVHCQYIFSINYTSAPTPTGAPTYTYESGGTRYYDVQGMTYDNGKLYYVMTAGENKTPRKHNYIFAYEVGDITSTATRNAIPSESIYVTSSTYSYFLEIESVDIHDGTMYFSANAGKYGYYEDYDFAGKLKHSFAVTPEYTVNFCDETGKSLQSITVKEGQTATYTGATPTKSYDSDYHYSFRGWLDSVGGASADLSKVKGDMTVYAGFTATAHSYTEEITLPPSCSAEGSKTLSCSCGRSYKEAIAATAHSPVVVNAREATCTQEGYSGDTVCSVCNKSLATGTVIEALPHSPVTDKGYAPTCSAAGLSDGSHCGLCGKVLEEQLALPPLAHSLKLIPGKEPGCLSSGLSDGLVCDTCGTVIEPQTVLPRLGHEYRYEDQGDRHKGTCIRCGKTVTEAHSFVDGRCVCGAGIELNDVDENIVIQHSLNLASDISVNYAVKASLLTGYDSYYLECKIPVYENNVQTGTRTVQIAPVAKGSYYYFTLTGLNAATMNHQVKATLIMDKQGQTVTSPTDSYSIADYAYAQLNKDSASETLKALCANLLRYGALTQIYKNYCTDSLPDAKLTTAQRAYLTALDKVVFDDVNRVFTDLSAPAVTWAGKALILDSKVTLKFVVDATGFEADPTELELHIGYVNTEGKPQTAILKDPTLYQTGTRRYSFDFDGLLAAELRSPVSATVYHGGRQVSATLEYSASSYGNGKSGTLLNLCKALMAYSDSAKAYFTA